MSKNPANSKEYGLEHRSQLRIHSYIEKLKILYQVTELEVPTGMLYLPEYKLLVIEHLVVIISQMLRIILM